VVAKVDDAVITVGDVQERINKQAPFIRSRYTTIEKKKEFLDNLIRFEVMARRFEPREGRGAVAVVYVRRRPPAGVGFGI
jgi:peptidyl-prolyl cis-trans isomerase C